MSRTIEEQATEGRKQASQILSGLNNAVEEALKSTGESVKKQVEMIDKASEREIEQVIKIPWQTLGKNLLKIINA